MTQPWEALQKPQNIAPHELEFGEQMYAFQGTVKSNAVGCGQGGEAINIALVAEQRKR